jgi:hypothetical protein
MSQARRNASCHRLDVMFHVTGYTYSPRCSARCLMNCCKLSRANTPILHLAIGCRVAGSMLMSEVGEQQGAIAVWLVTETKAKLASNTSWRVALTRENWKPGSSSNRLPLRCQLQISQHGMNSDKISWDEVRVFMSLADKWLLSDSGIDLLFFVLYSLCSCVLLERGVLFCVICVFLYIASYCSTTATR